MIFHQDTDDEIREQIKEFTDELDEEKMAILKERWEFIDSTMRECLKK